MKKSVAKTSSTLLITLGIILIHVIVIGLVVWGCNNSSAKKKKGETPKSAEQTAGEKNGPSGKPEAPQTRYRKPSANPNFGKPLDFRKADRRNLPVKLVPGLKEWNGTGIIVDMGTREVLWEKDSHKAVPVASMVKMMTMLLVAEELERNTELTLDTKIPVTASALKALPERSGLVWLANGEEFTVRELLTCVAVKSANDAATLLGERVGGSVDGFVDRMNKRAKELDMKSTVFHNPCGLTDKRRGNSKSSAADMVLLGERLLEYPFLLEMCSTKQASIRDGKTVIATTNKLIAPHYPGVDGLKTGYIRVAGACLTFSVIRNGRRIVGCVTGFGHARDRDYFCRRLIDWAYDPQSINKPAKPQRPAGKAVKRSKRAKSTKGTKTQKKK